MATRRPDLKDMCGALLLAACTPDGGVQFDTPLTGLSGPASSDGGGTEATGEATGSGSGLPPSTTLPPPSTTTPTTSATGEPTATAGDTDAAPTMGTLVPARSTWRYLASASPPAGDWAAPGFDDSAWPEGPAPIGEDGDVATVLDPAAAPVGVYVRHRFTAAPGADRLMLYLRRGDGAAVYLNGVELVRSNMPDVEITADTPAQDDLSGNEVLRYLRFAAPTDALVDGENVIAATLRRKTPGQPGLGFDLQVDAIALADLPTDELRAQWRTRRYGGEYAPENVGVAWIERDSGEFVRTLTVWAEVRGEHLVRWRASSDGNKVDAMTGATRGSHRTSEVAWDLRDALGQLAAPGAYRLMFEYTEEDSNGGDPPGPRLELPFTLGAGPVVVPAPADAAYKDILVIAP
jgi:hypothetical protein